MVIGRPVVGSKPCCHWDVAGFADATPCAASSPVRCAQRGQGAGGAAGDRGLLPAAGCGRDHRPGLPGPVREVALATHGQVIEALVANRLTSPAPLVHVQDWAGRRSVDEVWGIDPTVLNDVRIGRALDAIAPGLEQIVGSVGARAIGAFGLDVARLHWDLTSISLYGAYPDPDDGFPAPRYGHPKDRRPDLKQVQTGLAVTGDPDGGVPVLHRADDGGAVEVAQVIGAMTSLKQLAGRRRLLLVGDSKLVSYPNLRAMIAAKVGFIAPASKTYVPAQTFAALDPQAATPVDYVAARDQHKPPERRGSWRVIEDTMTLAGKAKRDPVLSLRRVLVWSSARDQAALDALAATDGWYALLTNLDPAEADAAEILRRYKGQEVVERRYGSFKGPLAVAPMFLKNNRRIAALITVICLALLIFCLVERQVRQAIAPAQKLDGLWAHRPAKPTGRLIFTALAKLRLLPASGPDPPVIPRPPPLQARILELLTVDATRPR